MDGAAMEMEQACMSLEDNYSVINQHDGNINFGCSVRCVKDEEQKK